MLHNSSPNLIAIFVYCWCFPSQLFSNCNCLTIGDERLILKTFFFCVWILCMINLRTRTPFLVLLLSSKSFVTFFQSNVRYQLVLSIFEKKKFEFVQTNFFFFFKFSVCRSDILFGTEDLYIDLLGATSKFRSWFRHRF